MPSPQNNTSVVICTYSEERWSDLTAAVASLRTQTVQAREIIVVVDHNDDLLARVRRELDDVVVIENGEAQGLSGARNSGIAVAQGEYVAFLDDDAVAATDWLEQLSICCAAPSVLGAGGAAEPVWEGRQPAWFPQEFLWVVGCSYRGLPTTIAPIRNPFGGCSCIRREVLVTLDGFRSDVGRIGTRPIGCEDTELSIRARQRWPGHTFVFNPNARIYHRVPAKRATLSYFRARCFAEGMSKAIVAELVGVDDALEVERLYVRQTLTKGLINALRNGLVHADVMALARAAAITGGLLITAAGYGSTVLHRRLLTHRAAVSRLSGAAR